LKFENLFGKVPTVIKEFQNKKECKVHKTPLKPDENVIGGQKRLDLETCVFLSVCVTPMIQFYAK
jgi:hypothetical protein